MLVRETRWQECWNTHWLAEKEPDRWKSSSGEQIVAKCLECGGKLKWRNPFYVCLNCGVSYRKHEFAKAKDAVTQERWRSEVDDDDEKRKKASEYERWYLKQGEG